MLDAEPAVTLDLHGDSAVEAERRVRDFVQTHALLPGGRVVHIVTGRGQGSGRAPVLPGVVRRLLGSDLSRFVEEFDRDLDDGGFLVRLKYK